MFSENLVNRILDHSRVGRLAQLDGHGEVQALPFVFVRCGASLWSPIDGKPKRSARLSRLDWIAQHPQVCVLVDHYEADWEALWWLKLYGQATVERSKHASWQHVCQALAKKYPQYIETAMFLGEPTMIRFQWTRYKAWAAAGEEALEASF